MRKADDGGEGAQFVGDVVDEIDLHLVGGFSASLRSRSAARHSRCR